MNSSAKLLCQAALGGRGGAFSRRFFPSIFMLLGAVPSIWANPQGMTVAHGTATANRNGNQLNIRVSQNAVLNWQSFNIAAGEITRFLQPNSRSVVWNQIYDRNPSQIWGSLQANGTVILMNQNGFYFGPHSQVTVGGFIAASAAVLPPASVGGGFWSYQGPPPSAHIINYGSIHANSGGSIFLIAEGIENHGVISAPDGQLGLYAGKHVLISERPDGRGLSAAVQLPEGTVNNQGTLVADAGAIALRAQVVNQNGLIQANSIRSRRGVIELVASDSVNLGSHSVLRANGDANAISSGGRIELDSAQTFFDDPGSIIQTRGGGLGGNGGEVQLCALSMPGLESRLDGTARPGWRGADLVLDPYNITLSPNSGRGTPSGTINSGDPPVNGTLVLNVNRAFTGFSQIHLEALHDIVIGLPTTPNNWNLDLSTGISAPGSLLTLEAGNNIVFNNNSHIFSAGGWSVSLSAGVDFSSPTHTVRSGIGGIYFNGGPNQNYNGSLETASGNITLNAGHEILVGSGFVRTVGGGNISLTTLDGDVNAGNKFDTYDFSSTGYTISALGLGGIGTAAGGDVEIHSGRDILSAQSHIGAFGTQRGNVRLDAARNVTGNFMVENGAARVTAGHDIGSGGTGASFGLSRGGWTIHAGHDLYLNEIFNPDGSLNPNRSVFGQRLTFQFDYGASAYADLFGAHSIVLTGDNIAHTADNPVRSGYAIYPPILSMEAGSGGITLDRDVILYPSVLGSLQVITTGGGSFGSAPGSFCQLVLSDSGSGDYRTFADDHAASPLHLAGLGDGVDLDISGNLQDLFLRSPEAADIRVHRNAINFSFEGQNLSGHDATRLQIDGNYFSRSDRTFVTVNGVADLAILTDAIRSMDPELGARLTYDPVTHRLGLQGIMTQADLNFLLHPTAYQIDPRTGQPALDNYGNPIVVNVTFTTDTAALRRLFAASQDIPDSPLAGQGLQLGGPGQFVISAHNMDLGTSAGIRSVGPLRNPNLARVSLQGASITLNLSGDLDITSSQIASFNGGNISLNSLGSIQVGSQDSITSDDTPKGIYTAHGGSVSVQAVGDIDVNGSRIASYDGGDVSVISLNGNVDAGAGARGFFSVTTSEWDPITHTVDIRNDRFFGSGIMALTRTDSDTRVGNITVRAGRDILANAGGIIQLAFNSYDQSAAFMELYAGRDIIADQSGILGHVRSINAGGNVVGKIVSTGNNPVSIQLGGNFIGTVLSSGSVSMNAGGTIAGSIVGAGNVNVSGSEITASVISTGGNANTSGNTAGSTVGAFTSVAAPAAQKSVEAADKTVAADNTSLANAEDDKKKRASAKGPVLVRRVGRVTVILPEPEK
jgi:filamentous hemagglutinin family protein